MIKKSEILKNYQLQKIDENSVLIINSSFIFSYVKEDEISISFQYNGYESDKILLEIWLCEIAERVLNVRKDYSKASEILKSFEDKNEYHFHKVDRGFILEAMEEYADQSNEVIYNLFNAPAEILNTLNDEYREENPRKDGRFYIPDMSQFYKWIVNKIKCNK